MPPRRIEAGELLARARARWAPCTETGGALLDIYFAALELPESRRMQMQELEYAYALLRIVEAFEFSALSIATLLAAANSHNGSANAKRNARVVIRRIIKLLQQRGQLPASGDVARSEAIERELEQTPEPGRPVLRRWLARRRHHVGWIHLHREARRLRKLEQLYAVEPHLSESALLGRWRKTLVRATVDCGCHPAPRALNPLHCRQCDATPETHLVIDILDASHWTQFKREAENYLRFRHAALQRQAS